MKSNVGFMGIVSPADISAQLERTNAAIDLLLNDLGDVLKECMINKTPPPPFDYKGYDRFVDDWKTWYHSVQLDPFAMGSGGTYDRAVEWLNRCHEWRKKAYDVGAVKKKDDPYVPPKEDPPLIPMSTGFGIGAGIALVAILFLFGLSGRR